MLGPPRHPVVAGLVIGVVVAFVALVENQHETMRNFYAFAGDGTGARRTRYILDLLVANHTKAAVAALGFLLLAACSGMLRNRPMAPAGAMVLAVLSCSVEAAVAAGAMAFAAFGALTADLATRFPGSMPEWWPVVSVAAIPAVLWGVTTVARSAFRLAVALAAGPALVTTRETP